MSIDAIEVLYESLQVNEKRNFCPRLGIYRLIGLYQGSCYGKLASMVKCNWRPTYSDDYQTSFVTSIQLESFKNNADLEQLAFLDLKDVYGFEIEVLSSQIDEETKKLNVKWKIIKQIETGLDKLNKLQNSGVICGFEVDQLDEYATEAYDDFLPEM